MDILIHDGPIQGAWGYCGRWQEDFEGQLTSMAPEGQPSPCPVCGEDLTKGHHSRLRGCFPDA